MRKTWLLVVDGFVQNRLVILRNSFAKYQPNYFWGIRQNFCSGRYDGLLLPIHSQNYANTSAKSLLFHTIHMTYNKNYIFKLSNY
jgi:hypothetical protein